MHVGGELNAFTEKEHTCYYATVLDRDLPLAVDIVIDVVLNATVTAHDVDVERSVVLEEIAMRDDDPADLVHDVFASTLFGDTPLGRPILRLDHLDHGTAPCSNRRLLSPPVPPARHGRIRSGQRRSPPPSYAASERPSTRPSGRAGYQTARRQDQSRPAPRATIVSEETEQANIVPRYAGHISFR